VATDLAVPDGRTLYISKERGVEAKWGSSISGY